MKKYKKGFKSLDGYKSLDIMIVVFAWLIAFSLVYILLVKIHLLHSF